MVYDRLMIDLCKAIKTGKSCASENWFEEVINPNAIYGNTISTEKFFRATLTNQDGKLELDSLTNNETCVRSEILDNAKPGEVTSTDPMFLAKHKDSNEKQIPPVLGTPKISNPQSIYYPIFQPFIETSPTFSQVNAGTKMFCPIYNKRFFVKEINEHADECLTRKTQRNITDITNHLEAEDATSYIDLNANDTDKSNTTDTKSQFCQKLNLF